jgi:uncharacterized protein YfaS (alpha-2-macroglobulin family)
MRLGRAVTCAAAATLLALSAVAARAQKPLRPGPAREVGVTAETGLSFRLSEGAEAPQPAQPRPSPPPASPLPAGETERVLQRLPPLPPAPTPPPFALRESSLPPPRTGVTVKDTFPPPGEKEGPGVAPAPTLEVLRRSPEGEVPLAPNVSITFSQPMVEVTSHAELEKGALPARLDPQPPGRWSWVGARTLVFEPESPAASAPARMPMATEYRVEVSAGTRSAVGGTLAQAVRWTIGTPPATLVEHWPADDTVRRDPVFFAAFDQRIDPAAVLATVRAEAGGSRHPLRLATSEEVAADEELSGRARRAAAGRWLAFKAVQPLPADAEVEVTVGPGTPSAEGPRRTTKTQSWTVRTFGPLKLIGQQCGWGGECRPGTPFRAQFSNAIDAEAFRPEMLRVEPALPAMAVDVLGSWLHVRGRMKGGTRYTVTFTPELRDVFGQTLGAPARAQFTTTHLERHLMATSGGFVVLDPSAPPRFSVWSVNHSRLHVSAWAVTPADWPAFREYQQQQWRNERGARPTPPGRRVIDTEVAVRAEADELVETRIDVAPALTGGLGHVVLLVEPVGPAPKEVEVVAYPQRVLSWVQATRIGLAAFVDAGELVAWATALADGAPLPGVDLQLMGGSVRGTTDAQGLARLALTPAPAPALVATRGADAALLPAETDWSSEGGWEKEPREPHLRWFVFDDRGMYRPGEEVRIKGWARVVDTGKGGDVRAWDASVTGFDYTARDAQGNEIAKGRGAFNAWGGFDLTLKLPPTMTLGQATVLLKAARYSPPAFGHDFQVQEFRRPEYEVTVEASQAPHFVTGSAAVSVSAQYYAGGSLSAAPVTWTVVSSTTTFRPPNRDDFTFGRSLPWWDVRSAERPQPDRSRTLEGETDASGKHRLRIDFDSVDPPLPSNVRAQATVLDVNRQAWSAGVDLLVHPADVYVGLRTEKPFVERGAAYAVEAIVTDLGGAAVAGRAVEVVAERLEWRRGAKGWEEQPVEAGRCTLTSTSDVFRCALQAGEGGAYRIRATVRDGQGRPNLSEIRLWVSGGKVAERRDLEQDEVTLVPGKQDYRVGETAEILVVAPFAPAEGLMTLRRSGLVRSERFRMAGSTHTLRVPIEESHIPNVHVQVDLVGAAPRGEGQPGTRPAFASGTVDLRVPPLTRTLALEVKPREQALEPGGRTTIDVALEDAAGRPVPQGEVALWVVDEAVLALTGYSRPDPLAAMYVHRFPDTEDHHLRSSVVLGETEPEPGDLQDEMVPGGHFAQSAVMEMARAAPPPPPPASPVPKARNGAGAEPIRMRSDFRALALFAASVVTDGEGRAQVALTVPDSLTRYRILAVGATRGREFGSRESTLTVRLPLMVRPSPPRFLNFGDRFELPVVVQNQTQAPLSVDVAVRAQGLTVTAGSGRRVEVPASDRVEVRFPMAVDQVGTARVQVGAASGRWTDAAEVTLPVWTPATTEAFATYGQIDAGAVAQPVKAPGGVIPQFGGLEVTTSSTALQSLTDAVLYLVAYPFECAEQLSSRVLGIAALRDVLAAFQAEGLPEPKALEAAVAHDLERLAQIQNDDGGFPFWRRGDVSWPYVSIHATLAMERARAKKFDVPSHMLESAHGYLKTIEKRIPADTPDDVRRTLLAYALYVRHRLGDRDPARARALVREAGLDKLSFEALGWLLPVLGPDPASSAETDAIRRRFANSVAETAAAAHFAVSYGEAGEHLLLHSNRRADAVVLEALIGDQPRSDLIPKLVEGLLGHRTAGRWTNTQENVFVLLALDRYFQVYEKTTPDFVARLWLGDRFAGEHAFRGRTTERHHVEVPMQAVAEQGRTRLVLAKDGAGRLYYRIGLRYAPSSLRLEPADHGFAVERVYQAVDDPADVRRDGDGTWHVRAGARVRVTLKMAAPGRRTHVALVDPLPGGLEALNPVLAVTGTIPEGDPDTVDVIGGPGLGGPRGSGHWWRWRRTWYDHQNMRDERVEAFASLLFEGVYSYSYVARATTPGTFVVPPPKAEEMYHPETFGRGGTDRVVVE